MPVHKSALKRMKTGRKRYTRNAAIRSELKTILNKVDQLLSQKLKEEATSTARLAASKLDKAVTSGIIHKKTASRKKSRIARKLAKLLSA